MIVPIYNNSNNKNPEYTCPTDAGCDLRADFSRISPDNPLKIYGDGGIIFAGEGHPLHAKVGTYGTYCYPYWHIRSDSRRV